MADAFNESVTGTPTPDEALRLAKSAYSESTDYFNAGIRREIERDMRQAQGLHPVDSKYESTLYRGRAKFFSPKTRAAIRKSEAKAAAAFFSQQDVVSVDPENEDDPANVASAKLHHHLLNIRLKKSIPWFLTMLGAFQDAETVGVCISYQTWQFNKKKNVDRPWIDLRPVENFRFSPSCDWRDPVGTSPYLIDMLPMYIKDVRSRMQQPGPGGEAKWLMVSDADLLVAAKKYSDSITLLRSKGRTDPQSLPAGNIDFQKVWVHRNVVEVDGVDYMWYTLADVQLLSKPVRLDSIHLHGLRPYAVGFAVVETHKVYPSGKPRLTRDVQGEINELRNLRNDNVRFALNKRYFVKRGAQVDVRSLVHNVPGSATMVTDPDKDVKVIETGDVTGSAYQEQDRLNADFDEVAGAFGQSSVQGNRELSDKLGGLQILTDDANELFAYELRCFAESWVKPVLNQIIALEQHFENDKSILKLAATKAEVPMVDDELLMMPSSVSVNVGVGAVSPQRRLGNLIFALKSLGELVQNESLMQAGLDVEALADEIFSKCGYDSGARFFKWDGQDPQVAMLQQQIQSLQDSLKAKDPPELVQAKIALLAKQAEKVDADKVKTLTEAIFGSMQAGEVVAAVPSVAPIADSLMKAAGYEVPTPPGVDPNLVSQNGGDAAPAAPAPGLSTAPVSNPRDGIGFTPGAAQAAPGGNPAEQGHPLPAGMPSSTHPNLPMPTASPATGMKGFEHGIETVRPDSAPTGGRK